MSALPQVLIRDMGFDDVGAVVALERDAYPFPWSEGIFRDCLRVGYYCCVMELDDVPIGYAILTSGAGEAHVLNLCVDRRYRCRGLGGALLDHLLEFARGLAVEDVLLEVRPSNTVAVRLYHSRGFVQVGIRRGYYQAHGGREDAVVLRRRLRPSRG